MLVIILILINIIDITVEVAALFFTGLLVDEGIVTPEGKYLITWFNILLQYHKSG